MARSMRLSAVNVRAPLSSAALSTAVLKSITKEEPSEADLQQLFACHLSLLPHQLPGSPLLIQTTTASLNSTSSLL